MIKDIKYNGYTTKPGDFECTDGDLDASVNLINEDGSLRGILPPYEIAQFPSSSTFKVYLTHTVSDDGEERMNFLGVDLGQTGPDEKTQLQVFRVENGQCVEVGTAAASFGVVIEEIYQVTSIGNTVCALTDYGMYYFLWKDGAYVSLGNQLPSIDPSYRLDVYPEYKTEYFNLCESGTSGDYDLTDVGNKQPSEVAASYIFFDGEGHIVTPTTETERQTFYLMYNQRITLSDLTNTVNGTEEEFSADKTYKVTFDWRIWGICPDRSKVNVVISKLVDGTYTEVVHMSEFKEIEKAFLNGRVIEGSQLTDSSRLRVYMIYAPGKKPYRYVNGDYVFVATGASLYSQSGVLSKYALLNDEDGRNVGKFAANVNALIGDNKQKFLFPFFVRVALRLYDGSIVCPSAPALVIPALNGPDIILNTPELESVSESVGYKFYFVAHCSKLSLKIGQSSLQWWSDIVKEVVIGVTPSIYTRDIFASDKDLVEKASINVSSYNPNFSVGRFITSNRYLEYNTMDALNELFDGMDMYYYYDFPHVDGEDLLSKVNSLTFHIIDEIKIEDLEQYEHGYVEINHEKVNYQTLQTLPALNENSASLDLYKPKVAFAYNSRLQIADYTVRKRPICRIGAMNPMVDPEPDEQGYTKEYKIRITYNENGQVRSAVETFRGEQPYYLHWIFLQSSNITEAVLYTKVKDGSDVIRCGENKLKLFDHTLLDGVFAFSDFERIGEGNYITEEEYAAAGSGLDSWIDVRKPNYIKVSEAENPFVFTNVQTYTVGQGRVMGLSSAVKALSQGQFGEFPLYAFSTEGVWALQLADNGTYKAVQPVSRDVCINPDTIAQMDDSVAFASDRGMMVLQGSQAECVSEMIDENTNIIETLPKVGVVKNLAGLPSNVFHTRFREFLASSRAVFDYVNQRIVVYGGGRYAYVYSCKSKMWGMCVSDLQYSINAYPHALAMSEGNMLVDVDGSENDAGDSIVDGLLITRPFKVADAHDVLKTVDTVIQRGSFRPGALKSVVWGSRDGFNWLLVKSSVDHYLRGFRGTPYKWYRLGVIAELGRDESLRGFTVQFTPRLVNQPR